jgi:hypothetical protein
MVRQGEIAQGGEGFSRRVSSVKFCWLGVGGWVLGINVKPNAGTESRIPNPESRTPFLLSRPLTPVP